MHVDPAELSLAQRIALLPQDQRDALLAGIDQQVMKWEWKTWARPAQYIPPDDTHPRILLLGGRGGGKQLSLDTRVPTPGGWTTMGEVRAGDQVLDEAGRPCTVLVAHEIQRPEVAYRLTFSDGTWIDACSEHSWCTWTHRDRKQYLRYGRQSDFPEDWPTYRQPLRDRWGNVSGSTGPAIRTTQDIVDTFLHSSRGDRNHCIPVAGALSLPERDLVVDPWLLGYWLGNGSRGSGVLTSGSLRGDFDHWHVAALLGGLGHDFSLRVLDDKGQARFGVRGLLCGLRAIGVLHSKRIPPEYLRASESQRLSLLRGLMDSDGFAAPVGDKGLVEYSSSDGGLANDVLELVRTLSERPVLSVGRATLDGRDMGPKWRVTWTPSLHNPFALPRKAERVGVPRDPKRGQGLRLRHRMISSFERLDDPPLMRCITVDSPNSLYLVGDGMIPTHNTRAGTEWARAKARLHPGSRGILVARTAADVRDVLISGPSGILNVHPPSEMPTWEPSKRLLTWPSGSSALAYSAETPDALRGIQSHWSLADEIGTWEYTPDASGLTAWDNLLLATRLGDHPQVLAMTTPRRLKVIRDLLTEAAEHPDRVMVRRFRTVDNRGNLSQAYIDAVVSMYEGTALAAQELEGLMLDDVEGALWAQPDIDANRLVALPPIGDLHRPIVVVGVDPSVAETPRDECGIVVVVGTTEDRMVDRHAYIVEDASVHGSPRVWSDQVVRVARKWGAVVVAEVNQGGALVRSALENVDPGIRVVDVHSRFGKALRAEPVQLASQQGRVHVVGELPLLEAQMCEWIPETTRKSPDRLDACVHAVTAIISQNSKLIGGGSLRARPGVRRQAAARASRYPDRGAVATDGDGRRLDAVPEYMRRTMRAMGWVR